MSELGGESSFRQIVDAFFGDHLTVAEVEVLQVGHVSNQTNIIGEYSHNIGQSEMKVNNELIDLSDLSDILVLDTFRYNIWDPLLKPMSSITSSWTEQSIKLPLNSYWKSYYTNVDIRERQIDILQVTTLSWKKLQRCWTRNEKKVDVNGQTYESEPVASQRRTSLQVQMNYKRATDCQNIY